MGESCNIKWNTYTHHLADMLGDILTSELYSDVGLECEGGRLNALRAVLSACSPFFKHIFEEDDQEVMRDDHPVIWMPGIQMSEMEAILQFMYCGQTNFEQKQTYRFLSVGKHLGIKELDRDIYPGGGEDDSGSCDDSKMSDVSDILHEANGIMHGTFAPNGEEAPDLLNLDLVKDEPKSDSMDQSDCVMYGNPMDPEVSMSGAPPGKIAIQPEKKRVRKRPETNREPMKKGPKDSKYMHIAPDPNSCVCPECDKVFAHRKNMIAHYKSQHEGTRVTCQYCSKEFSKQGNLKMHIQSVHEGAKYTCNICDQQFSYANNLKTHIQSVHEGVKYPCTYCEKIYTDKSTLFRHIQSKHKQNI